MTYTHPSPIWASKQDVEEFAESVGATLNFEIGGSLEQLVSNLGGSIVYGGLNDSEADGGAIVAKSNNDFTIYLSKMTAPIRDRFTIAHELGHLFLHLPSIVKDDPNAVMRATRLVDNDDDNQKRAEWEANWFAAGLLMPASAMQKYADKDASYVSARFNVSKQSAEIRLKAFSS